MSDNKITVLPDGSAFATMSMALPDSHWIYETDQDGFSLPPPMPLRMGIGPSRDKVAAIIREAGRYAVRASTMNGKDTDFDPDAMIQNLIVGFLGYWTSDGLIDENWGNPDPVPPIWEGL